MIKLTDPIANEREKPMDDTKFPQILWHGVFKNYLLAHHGRSEVPEPLHFGASLVAIGSCFGNSISFDYPHRHLSNVALVIVGKSGIPRKDTAARAAWRIPKEVGVNVITQQGGLATGEGLVEALKGDKVNLSIFDPEVAQTLKKGHTRNSILLMKLREALDSPPELKLPTRTNPLVATDPFLSFLGATTKSGLEDAINETDFSTGTLNRFLWIHCDEDVMPIPEPLPPEQGTWGKVIQTVKDAVDHWTKMGHTKFFLSTGASELWDQWYRDWWRKQRVIADPIIAAATERTHTHIRKVAMIMAAVEKRSEISADDLRCAIAFGEYCQRNAEQLFSELAPSKSLKIERRIEAILVGTPDLEKRRIQTRLGGHYSSEEFNRCFNAMLKAGKIEEAPGHNPKSFRIAGNLATGQQGNTATDLAA